MNDPAKNPYAASASTPGGLPGGLPDSIRQASRTGLIITFALAQGVLVISAVVGYLGVRDLGADQGWIRADGDSMLYILIGFGVFVVNGVLAFVLSSSMKRSAVAEFQSSNEEVPQPLEDDTTLGPAASKLLGMSATWTLVGQALLEGSAVINAVFMMLASNLIFVIPILFAIVGIAFQAPFPGKLRAMIENTRGHRRTP